MQGTYGIHDCGDRAQAVAERLAQTSSMAQAAIADATDGENSDHGYMAIFKDVANAPYINTIFRNISTGAPLPVNAPQGMQELSPMLVCVPPSTTDSTSNYFKNHCSPYTPPAVHILGTQWVVLCPSFFGLKDQAQSSDCPSMSPVGSLLTPYATMANQCVALLRQLSHFYLGASALALEITAPNNILRLAADFSKCNPGSYALYATSESELSRNTMAEN